jgi:hypothetical protein
VATTKTDCYGRCAAACAAGLFLIWGRAIVFAHAMIIKMLSAFGPISGVRNRASCVRASLALLVVALFQLALISPSFAISAGCSQINATWGGGLSVSSNASQYLTYSLLAGEKVTYSATTSGNTNAPSDPFNGSGFALYGQNGSTVILEQYNAPDCTPEVRYDNFSDSAVATKCYRAFSCAKADDV